MRSPVLTSMSYSRGGWVALTELARWMRSSVVFPMALTTATTSVPCRSVRAMWSATARIRSASPTEVPPNFWTTSGIRTRLQTGAGRCPGCGRPGRAEPDRGRSEPVPGLGRVSGRAQRQESPPARSREARLAAEAQAAEAPQADPQRRHRRGRAGVIVGIVFLISGGSTNDAPVQGEHDDQHRRREGRDAKLQAQANGWPSRRAARPAPRRGEHQKYPSAPAMTIDTTKTYSATVVTTAGTFDMRSTPRRRPTTVNNFVFLADKGYYHCVIFHRVIPGFMDQTGDPTGTGRAARATPSRTRTRPRRPTSAAVPARLARHGQHRPAQFGGQPVLHRRGPQGESCPTPTRSSAR